MKQGALGRLWTALRGVPPRTWVVAALLVVAIGAAVHQLLFLYWYIEDAAISFAFARHLADGEGLVAYPGGERVEGYSNPTWVALMALFEVVWVNAFRSSKIMGVVFGALTLPMVWAIARTTRPDRADRDTVALIAPLWLAISSQFAIWNASGLENSLFNLLLALAIWRALVEQEPGRWPIAPLAWFGLAITRPEGIAYAAIGGFWAMAWALADGRGLRPTVRWLLAFFVPWTAYQVLHYAYFAWPLPNTYYAKTDANDFRPWVWSGRGWKYIRRYAHEMGQVYLLPVYLVGLIGLTTRWRRWVALTATLALFVALLPESDLLKLFGKGFTVAWQIPAAVVGTLVAGFVIQAVAARLRRKPIYWADLPVALIALALVAGAAYGLASGIGFFHKTAPPGWWMNLRLGLLGFAALVLPVLGIGRPGWRALVLCWQLAAFSLFFALWSGGDWMKGFRWMSMMTVPMAVLFTAGLAALADSAQWRLGRVARERWSSPGALTALALLAAFTVPNVMMSQAFVKKPETGPYSVQKRVNYMNWVKKRLHIDEQVVNLDVDQGAHLWWSGHQMMDIAGLVDVSMGHHNYEKPFMREYVFEERRPHFAHVHGGWAGTSKIPTHPEWKRDYIEIPGYPTGKSSLHVGNHVRKDLLIDKEWTGTPGRAVVFADGITLHGFEVGSREVGRGMRLFFEIGLSSRKRSAKDDDFGVLVFLSDERGTVQSWTIPPGYDWYPTDAWEPAEIFHGRFSLFVPKKLPDGVYDVGIVILGPDGAVLAPDPAQPLPEGAIAATEAAPARFARGEVRFPALIELVSKERMHEMGAADVEAAITTADGGDCDAAEAVWTQTRRRFTWQEKWLGQAEPRVHAAMARCLAGAATKPGAQAVDLLARARTWHHREPALLAAARPVADDLYARAAVAREARDWELAYRLYADVLRIEPWRAWARRYAEEARDHRLGIDPETLAAQVAKKQLEREARQQKAEDRKKSLPRVPVPLQPEVEDDPPRPDGDE